MKRAVGVWVVILLLQFKLQAQVDTSYVYKTGMPYGTLDIRIAKSSTRYYYLQEDRTMSFREKSPGVKTNSYRDMTSWDSSPYGQGNLREKNGSADYFIMNYRLLKPLNYNASYDPGYPLIVFIHGAGERGNCWGGSCYHADTKWNPNTNNPAAPTNSDSKLLNNDHNLLHGGSTHLQVRNIAGSRLPNDPSMPTRAFPGFVLFPQATNGWNANTVQDAIKLVRLISKKYNIDENRIYIEGLSLGGYGVYEAIKRAPWLFAAAFTMSAVSDASITYHKYESKVAHIPLWTFQGGTDTNPTPSKTNGYVKKFKDAGMNVRYNLYPHLGHGTWNEAMGEGDYFSWMLAQNKANIHTFGGSTSICSTTGEGLKMQLSEGFRAYQWERNGVIISGANSSSYVATTTGTYRARFSRKPNPGANDWNQWSDPLTVTISNPVQPVVEQIGTLMLKGLDNYGDAKLKGPSNYEKYYWYKDGTRLSLNDTISRPTFKAGNCTGACTGNGAYTLVAYGKDNCPTPASKPKQIIFNNQSSVNITAPGNFTGTVLTGNDVRLNWSDASSNETGFEIWRRKVLTTTTYSKWEMRAITNANATTYTDKRLDPGSKYQYKIRAVSNSGRSNYTPSASNAYLVITTGSDGTAPSTPQNLVATSSGIGKITLSWKASTDNSGIKQYRIYYGSKSIATNSTQTTYTLADQPINTNYSFTVKAEDLGNNLSAASNTASANTYVTGLYYEHSTGSWTDLDNINWAAAPEYSGHVKNFTLAPRTQEDFFNFEYHGYLYINTPGTYYFQTISSDGSRLTLDGTVIINNDGVHGSRTNTSAAINLTAGPHTINLKYFELDEAHVLTVRWRGPDAGTSYVNIPDAALKSGSPTSGRMATTEEEAIVMEEPVRLNVYPNPTREDDINIQVDSSDPSPVLVRLIDFSGREVYQRQFNAEEVNYGVKILPRESMREGIYLLQINKNGKVIQERVSIKK